MRQCAAPAVHVGAAVLWLPLAGLAWITRKLGSGLNILIFCEYQDI